MLKFAFWILLAANIVAFASALDFSGTPRTRAVSTETRPVFPERISVLPPPATTASASERNTQENPAVTCMAFDGFASESADLFEKKLSFPAGTFKRTTVITTSSYMVYITPSKNMKHITNYFLIQDGKFRNAISLGIFKTEASARKLLAELQEQGISDLAIAGRGKQKEMVMLSINNPDQQQVGQINALLSEFPQITRKDCPLPDETPQ